MLIIVSDVDGVVRFSWRDLADPRVLAKIKSMLENPNVRVTFVSGSPVDGKVVDGKLVDVPEYRMGHLPLNYTLAKPFAQEVSTGQVTILGALGNQQLQADGTTQARGQYTPKEAAELVKLHLHTILEDYRLYGTTKQQNDAMGLNVQLKARDPNIYQGTSILAPEYFEDIILAVRKHLDPEFRIISYGATVESHSSLLGQEGAPKEARGKRWFDWFKTAMGQQPNLSRLDPQHRNMATGMGNTDGRPYSWLTIARETKGQTTKKYIQELLEKFPGALVVSVGDSQIDFPMFANAHLAFYVGPKKDYDNNLPTAPQSVMTYGEHGEDGGLFVDGNLKVLDLLQEGLGKSFRDLRYIPRRDASGRVNYCSLNDLNVEWQRSL